MTDSCIGSMLTMPGAEQCDCLEQAVHDVPTPPALGMQTLAASSQRQPPFDAVQAHGAKLEAQRAMGSGGQSDCIGQTSHDTRSFE
mmetsp:Transcript_1045/g.2140  ORF Transcript_1045/g.2140 Transcript_1045/m.2140 type:complete len:86 (+) Transcript_1045:1255-1512(+)